MRVRKYLNGVNRLTSLGYGSASLAAAWLLFSNNPFDGALMIATILGLIGIGGLIRCFSGYDEV